MLLYKDVIKMIYSPITVYSVESARASTARASLDCLAHRDISSASIEQKATREDFMSKRQVILFTQRRVIV